MDVPAPVAYDLSSHHALGGGSYAFKTGFPAYLKTILPEPDRRNEVNAIIQPNCTPHIGTLSCIGLTFIIARRLFDEGLDVSVTCDLWDRAKGEQIKINGITYQKSLRDKGKFQRYLPSYVELIAGLATRYKVHHRIRTEEELMSNPEIPGVLRDIISKRDFYGKLS
ncbi:uncharacterized protein FTOL_07498 [Fusarium torulosum]|uniref:Uncharacterized protein n=1 Tax=Fusarium torulosum TaxID=33205 RepID=A0AAE8MBZ9_9HYPO|nr:uncharacterized protein FTOL_07498 [Fusarium torulosum]